jgi:hypothetical protein
MPTIKMLSNKLGSPDGHTTHHYDTGKEYDVPQALADTFLEEKVAELVEGEKAEPAAPKNKAEKPLKNKAE